MLKSECYRLAQVAVMKNQSLEAEEKIEILRALMDSEDLAKYAEEKEKTVCECNMGDENEQLCTR